VGQALTPEQLIPKLVERGFELRAFAAYPRSMGAVRDGFCALLSATPDGHICFAGAAGYLLGDRIAVLVEREGRRSFQSKQNEVPVTPELLAAWRRFQSDLKELLS
jgi:hypothetical protein